MGIVGFLATGLYPRNSAEDVVANGEYWLALRNYVGEWPYSYSYKSTDGDIRHNYAPTLEVAIQRAKEGAES